MKYMKNLFIIILVLVLSAIFLGVIWEMDWRPLSEMTELGYQELKPVAKTTKPITVNGEHKSTQYYVVVEVDTEAGSKRCRIEIEEAYEEEDLRKCFRLYDARKKVRGFYYYSDVKEKVYFSKNIATAKEYMESRAKNVIGVVIGVDVAFIMIVLLTVFCGSAKLPSIPGGNWAKEQLIVCRYSNFMYGTLAIMCIAMSAGMFGLSGYLVVTAENVENVVPGVMFFFLAWAFIAVGILFILFMKNYALVLYPKGVVYRNAMGKTWSFSDEQIECATVIHAYRNHSFRIQTAEKNIWINYYCTNYNEAENFVRKKYMKMEEASKR